MFDGWFRSEGMMGAIGKMIRLHTELENTDKGSVAKIAVFAEGEALNRVRKNSMLTDITLSKIRRAFAEMGAPYALYSVIDLDTLPENEFSFIILLDCYDMPKERIEKVKALMANGVTVLSVYAPNYAKNGRCKVENITAVTGISVKESHTSHGELLADGHNPTLEEAPYFEIDDNTAEPLLYYKDGTVAAARKGNSVYAATPYVPSAFLRELARKSGAFIYSESPKVYTYVNRGAIGVYNATDADAVISVPESGVYSDKILDTDFIATDGYLTLPKRALNAYLLVKK